MDYDSIDDDNSKFEQFLQALAIYKEVYGELIIPNKFQVPNESPWPAELYGFKLGKRLQRLLISDFFINKYPEKKNALLQIGLNLSLDCLIDDWDIIYKALVKYKEIYGDVRVPNKYIVPREETWPKLCWDMKLGLKLSSIRSTGRYVKDDNNRKKQLDELGFEWRLRDHTHKQQLGEQLFEQIYEALVLYKENIDAELNVSPSYVIPADETWPEHLWNLKLGEYVQSIKDKDKLVFGHEEREKRLKELGLTFEESKKIRNSIKRFEMVCKALEVYKNIYGDLLVPQAFTVPSDDAQWDEELHGLKLGARVNAIRSQGALVAKDQKRMDKLNEMGFVWELHNNDKKKQIQLENTQDTSSTALLTFSRNYLNMNQEEQPITLQQRNIPETLENGIDPIAPLSNNAMSYDPSLLYDTVSFREIAAEAVREYMQDREMSNNPDIREVAHFEGKLTVHEYNKLITREIPEADVIALKKIGYRILEFGRFHWEDVVEGLKVYKRINGHIDVPKTFKFDNDIGKGNNYYHLQGLLLGEIVAGLRIGDIDGYEDPERRKILDVLGFQWGDKAKYLRFRFVPMFLALRIFHHLHGFCLPQHDFIIPDEPQWPYWMINMKLGKWASMARQQQKLLELHYPERYDMLQALGFLWWMPPGEWTPDLL